MMAAMLTAAELASMRTTQEEAMPDTCTLKRPTWTIAGNNAKTPGVPTTIGTYACLVSVATQSWQRIVGGSYGDVPQFVFALPYGTDVRTTDHIVYDGERYEVVGLLANNAWMTAVRAVCVRVNE